MRIRTNKIIKGNQKYTNLIMLIVLAFIGQFFFDCLLFKPESYIEKRTAYRFRGNPTCVYRYDSIKSGKDYNVIYVYSIGAEDASGFLMFVKNEWQELPISSDVLKEQVLDRSFDKHVENMLECSEGYWYWSDKPHNFMLYDLNNNLLYIRRSSFV